LQSDYTASSGNCKQAELKSRLTKKNAQELWMNMGHKTLVAYTSKGGATKEAAQTIADVLRNEYKLEVDLHDLKKSSVNIQDYANIVVGAGVRGGKVYGEALAFLKQDFGETKVSFFVCCGGAGDPKNYEESCTKYVTNVLAKYPSLKTVATEAFGGRMKLLGKTVFDNLDTEKIRVWAGTLGSKLT
jgi:menaquinone-dependent protoporphyrinogen IX oxidase